MILMAGRRSSKNPQPDNLEAFTKLIYKMAPGERRRSKESQESRVLLLFLLPSTLTVVSNRHDCPSTNFAITTGAFTML